METTTLYRDYIGYILGLHRGNGRENGSYHIIGIYIYRGYSATSC